MKLKVLGFVIFAGLITSCSSSKKAVTETNEIKQIKLTPELAESKSLYENNCGKCHTLHNPDKFSKEQWEPIVLRMQKKAKITDDQRESIYNYLVMNK